MKKSELKNIIKSILLSEGIIQPDASFVKPLLNSIKSKLIGQGLGNLEIEDILNDSFIRHDIVFESGWSEMADDPDMAQVCISKASTSAHGDIQILYTDEFYEIFENDDEWSRFVSVIQKLVSHELIHRSQIDKIAQNTSSHKTYDVLEKMAKNDKNSLRVYLSKPHEAMAFAKEAYLEFSEAGYSDEKILNRVREPFARWDIYPDRSESHIFWTYTENFDAGEPGLRQFLRYLYAYTIHKEI